VIDRQVQVLDHECGAVLGAQIGDAGKRIARLEPHCAGHNLARGDGQSAFAEAGPVRVQPRDIEALADLDRLPRRCEQFLGALVVGQASPDVAGHRREYRAGLFQHAKIVRLPAPNPSLVTKLRQAAEPPFHRLVAPKHLGARRKCERLGHRQISMRTRSFSTRTG
jgi:hypothetical protein